MRKAIGIVATSMILLFVVILTPAKVLAQSLNGTIYQAQGAQVPVFFNFSVSGQTFVATILTFGGGGNGRFFAAFGSTDGVSGTGQILAPAGFVLVQPAGASMEFQLDQPGSVGGSFAITGLGSVLSLSSGRFSRIFP